MENSVLRKVKVFAVLAVLGIVAFVGYKIYDSMKSVDFKIKVQDGLQISVDGINFKDEITKDDILGVGTSYEKAVNQVPKYLLNVSSAGGVTSGKLDIFNIDYTEGGEKMTAVKAEDVLCIDIEKCKNDRYIAIDVFLLAKEPTTLYLNKNSSVLSQVGNGKNGYYNAARVAFVVEGTVLEENKNNAQMLSGGSSSILWEPNYDDNKKEEGILQSYRAVDAEIKNSLSVGQIEGNFNFSSVTPDVYTKVEETEDKKLVAIPAGVTKLRIYMWVESRDVDMKASAKTNRLFYNIDIGANK